MAGNELTLVFAFLFGIIVGLLLAMISTDQFDNQDTEKNE